jgi:hypothetical protein
MLELFGGYYVVNVLFTPVSQFDTDGFVLIYLDLVVIFLFCGI